MNEGSTTAPSMLTEAELIALMDKHGIGTDATHAEHINTVKERGTILISAIYVYKFIIIFLIFRIYW